VLIFQICLYRKPQISSERLKILMEGRRLIRLSILHQKARGSDIDGDWVTIAVIVGKSEPKVSAKVLLLVFLSGCLLVVLIFKNNNCKCFVSYWTSSAI